MRKAVLFTDPASQAGKVQPSASVPEDGFSYLYLKWQRNNALHNCNALVDSAESLVNKIVSWLRLTAMHSYRGNL